VVEPDEVQAGPEESSAPEPEPEPEPAEEPMPASSTPASDFALEWFQGLLTHMSVEGEVQASGTEERVLLRVKAERAGRIIGKRGATLAAIRHLLGLALERFGTPVIDVDVADNRPRSSSPREKSGDGRRREGREPRRRDRDRDRDSRRPPRRSRGREQGGGGQHDPEKLTALAQHAAKKAVQTGKTITINLELNSYDRRLIHLAISEIEGVVSQSQERDRRKYVQISPELIAE